MRLRVYSPLRSSTCQSVRMRFLALKPGVHSVEVLTLTDVQTGFTMNLRWVLTMLPLVQPAHEDDLTDPSWTWSCTNTSLPSHSCSLCIMYIQYPSPHNPPIAQPASPRSCADFDRPQQYFELRSRQILKLKETKKPDPYPHKFEVSLSISAYIDKYGPEGTIKAGERRDGVVEYLAGRVHNIRASGASLRFYDLHGEGKKVQIMANKQ